ncbi:AI-2E family transporter [Echinimonas agarilytica]|uniref:AI-2E family transporter n=2 Tax=Echinimonas agarilytica TaxID=1215918 RepID=A0AA41W492_9GAMM|nr:AI-2E family transporter [Echinimonas agarilytica]MCM2678333.1 AI-2E family transporter [Echinimonas agarilytica]
MLLLAVYACYVLVTPYLEPIILAILFGLMMVPMNVWLTRKLGDSPNLAAVLSCIIVTFVILLPAFGVVAAIIQQGISYTIDLKSWVDSGGIETVLSHPWVSIIKAKLAVILPDDLLENDNIRTQIMSVATNAGKGFVGVSTGVLGSITHFVVQMLLMLFVLFFVLRDHDKLVDFVRHALPLSRSQEDALIDEIQAVSKSALLGTVLTALTQGAIGGFAMWLAGFPGLFWGTMMAFASLIPVVGTALIWLPAAIFLLIDGDTGWGIFLIVWGVVVVGSIDNFVRPMFMQGAGSMNTVVIFFSLLGGLHVFGLMGLLYGPLIFAITLVLFHLYETECKHFLDRQDNT